MSKTDVKDNLHKSKDFWNQAVADATQKIEDSRKFTKQLELAREVFRKNAAENVPIPGSRSAAFEAATHN
jgi:hypothetical protein